MLSAIAESNDYSMSIIALFLILISVFSRKESKAFLSALEQNKIGREIRVFPRSL